MKDFVDNVQELFFRLALIALIAACGTGALFINYPEVMIALLNNSLG